METIKSAIEQLSEPERRRLADWLDAMEEQAWDAEMKRDFSPGGRGQALVEKINREIEEGKFAPFGGDLPPRKERR